MICVQECTRFRSHSLLALGFNSRRKSLSHWVNILSKFANIDARLHLICIWKIVPPRLIALPTLGRGKFTFSGLKKSTILKCATKWNNRPTGTLKARRKYTNCDRAIACRLEGPNIKASCSYRRFTTVQIWE